MLFYEVPGNIWISCLQSIWLLWLFLRKRGYFCIFEFRKLKHTGAIGRLYCDTQTHMSPNAPSSYIICFIYLLDSWRPFHSKLKGLDPEFSYPEHESLLKPQKVKEKAIEILLGKIQMFKSNCLVTLLSYASFKTLSKSGKKGSFVKNRLWSLRQVLVLVVL